MKYFDGEEWKKKQEQIYLCVCFFSLVIFIWHIIALSWLSASKQMTFNKVWSFKNFIHNERNVNEEMNVISLPLFGFGFTFWKRKNVSYIQQ